MLHKYKVSQHHWADHKFTPPCWRYSHREQRGS